VSPWEIEGGIIDEMDGDIKALRYFKMELSRGHLDIVIFANPPPKGRRSEGSFFGSRKEELATLSIHKAEVDSLQYGGLSLRLIPDAGDKGELIEKRSEIFIDDKVPGSDDSATHRFQSHFVIDIERYSKCLVVKDRHGNSVTIRVRSGKLDLTGQGNVVRYVRRRGA
jgi:hypothetical protein